MENQEKIIQLTKEESDLILITIRYAFQITGYINESPLRILQYNQLFESNSTYLINIYNKIAEMLGYVTRITEEE